MLPVLLYNAYVLFDTDVLFDTGATFSCIDKSFVNACDVSIEPMSNFLSVNTLLRSGNMLNRICGNVNIGINGRHMSVDLIVLDMIDFGVILGVVWLVKYHTVINYQSSFKV